MDPGHKTLTNCLHHNDTDVESSISWSTWFCFTNANKATISQGTVSLSDRRSYQKMKQSLGTLRLDVCMYLWPCQEGIFVALQQSLRNFCKQGKSEGFESCDRPIVRKRPIWVKIGDVLYHVTLKFDGWPWKTKGPLSFAVSSFVQHFIAIGEFKLELQSGNAQFESNLTIFRALWPCNLTDDLEKQ